MEGMQLALERFRRSPEFKASLLKSARVRDLVTRRAEDVRAAASSMYGATAYEVDVKEGTERVRAFVHTADMRAVRSNFAHQTLEKALGGR